MKMILLFMLMNFFDATPQRTIILKSLTSFVIYPGFPTDTLETDSFQYCAKDYGDTLLRCATPDTMGIMFTLKQDSTLIEKSKNGYLINEFKIISWYEDSFYVEQSSVKIKFTTYKLLSKIPEYKNNVYVIEKLDELPMMRMYVLTDKSLYKVFFY